MPRWTPEARLRQAERIRQWSPWSKSTGPRTAEGKARSKTNAWKGGERPRVQGFTQIMRLLEHATSELKRRLKVNSSFCGKPLDQEYSAAREGFRARSHLISRPIIY